jgi:small subunit ribosomal protein S16
MATKIRLQRHGRGKRPFYTIVISDSRARRDGKYIERIGDYNPLSSPAVINVDVEKAVDWLMKGAEPTATVNAILKYKGALHRKHLLRGVAKGALTQEVADQKWTSWQEEHKNSVLDHQRKLHKSKEDRIAKMLEDEAKINREREEKRKAALAAAATPEVTEEAPVIAEEAPVDAPAETQEATETTETAPAE